MATYTYSFSPNTKIKSSEVNQNFNDVWPTNWTAYTPTITVTGGTAPTYTGRFSARYCQIGKVVFVMLDFGNSSGGTAGSGSGILGVSWPSGLVGSNVSGTVGNGFYFNSSAGSGLTAFYNSVSTFAFAKHGTASNLTGDDQNNAVRAIRAILMYEVT